MVVQTVTVFNLETNTSRFYEAVQNIFFTPTNFDYWVKQKNVCLLLRNKQKESKKVFIFQRVTFC